MGENPSFAFGLRRRSEAALKVGSVGGSAQADPAQLRRGLALAGYWGLANKLAIAYNANALAYNFQHNIVTILRASVAPISATSALWQCEC